jgi:hypothetical protein
MIAMLSDSRNLAIVLNLLLAVVVIAIVGYHAVRHREISAGRIDVTASLPDKTGAGWMNDSALRDASKVVSNGIPLAGLFLLTAWVLFAASMPAIVTYALIAIYAAITAGLLLFGGIALLSAGGGLALVLVGCTIPFILNIRYLLIK